MIVATTHDVSHGGTHLNVDTSHSWHNGSDSAQESSRDTCLQLHLRTCTFHVEHPVCMKLM